ncbi:MAG: hypothetical protein HY319_26390 [Armatimonadetes bacterium]|nr:hypothetical protein [Armatimonadota bacterium]
MQPFQNPMGINPQAAQAIATFRQITDALNEVSGAEPIVYLHEVKKLCLAVEAADQVRRSCGRAGAPPFLLRREVQHQLRSFAMMRYLPIEKVAEAAAAASRSPGQDPQPSRAARLVAELERVGGLPEEVLVEGMAVQPLTTVLVEQDELFERMESLFPFCVDHCSQLLYQIEKKLAPVNP